VDDGGRDVFAVGSIIINSSHLHTQQGTKFTEIEYSNSDANEIQVITIALAVARPYLSRAQTEFFQQQ
jgi:hypothetical protein